MKPVAPPSTRFPPPAVGCPGNRPLNQDCLANCRAIYDAAMRQARDAFCRSYCDAIDDYNSGVDQCHSDAMAEMVLVTPTIWLGPLSVLLTDATVLNGYRKCLRDAEQDYQRTVDRAQRSYRSARDAAVAAYRDCAADCCKPVRNRDVIRWE